VRTQKSGENYNNKNAGKKTRLFLQKFLCYIKRFDFCGKRFSTLPKNANLQKQTLLQQDQ